MHVVALGAIALSLQAGTDAGTAATVPAETRPPAAVPMEVVEVALVDLPVDAARKPQAAGPRPQAAGPMPEAASRTREAASRTPQAAALETASTAEIRTPEARGPRPEALATAATADVIARIAAARTPELPAAVEPSGKLHETGGGTARIDDGVAAVIVDADGTAHFKQKPNFRIHLLPKLPHLGDVGKDVGALLSNWYADPYRVVHEAGRTQDLPEHMLAVQGACDSYGSCITPPPDPPSTGNADPGDAGVFALLGGTFDITDYAMAKLHAGDPYRARKQALLTATFAERAERGAAFRADQLDRSAEMMVNNLTALWRATADPVQRREALFELWDECAEGDDKAGAAGDRARSMVIAWIRARLPADGPDAYTADELARLSARRTSKQAFAPY
jgi:hypothetical protein